MVLNYNRRRHQNLIYTGLQAQEWRKYSRPSQCIPRKIDRAKHGFDPLKIRLFIDYTYNNTKNNND